MRLSLAPTSALTDALGHNEKGRPCLRDCDRRRPVVSLPYKPIGVSALTPSPVFTLTHPVERTQPKLQNEIYHGRMGRVTLMLDPLDCAIG